jgi:hypothetical protein
MLGDVADGDRVRNSLKTKDLDQPVEQCGCVMVPNCTGDASLVQASPQISNIRRRATEAANGMHAAHRVGEISIRLQVLRYHGVAPIGAFCKRVPLLRSTNF